MSEENLKQFMSKVADSEELQAKIGEEIDTEALIALGAEYGCEFNAEEWYSCVNARNYLLDEIREHNADRRRTKSRKEIPMWTNHMLFTACPEDRAPKTYSIIDMIYIYYPSVLIIIGIIILVSFGLILII